MLQQRLLVAAAIVKEVKLQRLTDEGEALVVVAQFAQDGGFQSPRLVVVPVADEATVHLVEGFLVAALRSTNLGSLKVAGICPSLTPGRLPEQFVSLIIPSLVFQCEGKIIDWFAVIRIRIALGYEFDGLSQIALCLGEAPFPDVPQAHSIQATDVVGVSTQGLLIVVGR